MESRRRKNLQDCWCETLSRDGALTKTAHCRSKLLVSGADCQGRTGALQIRGGIIAGAQLWGTFGNQLDSVGQSPFPGSESRAWLPFGSGSLALGFAQQIPVVDSQFSGTCAVSLHKKTGTHEVFHVLKGIAHLDPGSLGRQSKQRSSSSISI